MIAAVQVVLIGQSGRADKSIAPSQNLWLARDEDAVDECSACSGLQVLTLTKCRGTSLLKANRSFRIFRDAWSRFSGTTAMDREIRQAAKRALFVSALTAAGLAAQTVGPYETVIVHKARGVTIQALQQTQWCEYRKLRLERAEFVPEPSTKRTARALTEKERAAADLFLERLDSDLKSAFASMTSKAGSGAARTLVVRPKLRRLNRNNPWLNVAGLAALQSPLKGSGMTLELTLTDAGTQERIGSVLLVGKGFWGSQLDLDRYRYSLSSLGQAQALARTRAKEAARQLGRLTRCDHFSAPASKGPEQMDGGRL